MSSILPLPHSLCFLFHLVFCYSYSLSAVFLWRNKRHTWIKLDLEPPKWPLMRNLFLPDFCFFFFFCLYCGPQRNCCRCFQGTPAKQKEDTIVGEGEQKSLLLVKLVTRTIGGPHNNKTPHWDYSSGPFFTNPLYGHHRHHRVTLQDMDSSDCRCCGRNKNSGTSFPFFVNLGL